ncbi:MAG: hypothetical protein EBR86_16375 [Planctomycetia bacterium]|nr:hypothetical protein [Planctomycetia bacterium]
MPGDSPPATAADRVAGSPRRAPLRLAAGSTRVDFSWAGDRWQHVVTVPFAGPCKEPDRTGPADQPQRHTLWHSVEDSITHPVDPRRPASPAITDLSTLGPAAAPTAILGVGHAGLGHCSLAVTIDADDPAAVRFHVACRLTAAWPGLGSTYLRDERWSVVAAGADEPRPSRSPHTVVWTYRIGPAGLVVVEGATLHSGAGPLSGEGRGGAAGISPVTA